jgi:hypothetical protein
MQLKMLNGLAMCAIAGLFTTLPTSAQVAADLVAVPGIGPGPAAPNTPAGVVIIGSNIWVGDAAQGFRHNLPVDPNNADPINTGRLMFDINTDWSIGGYSCLSGARLARLLKTVRRAPASQSTNMQKVSHSTRRRRSLES